MTLILGMVDLDHSILSSYMCQFVMGFMNDYLVIYTNFPGGLLPIVS